MCESTDVSPESGIPRPSYEQVVEALGIAYRHIVDHHADHIVQRAGQFCPVCHHEDHTEPEMDQIVNVLHAARCSI